MDGRFIGAYKALVAAMLIAFKDPRARRKASDQTLGIICGHGPKTITSAIKWNGRQLLDWSSDYKLFSRAKWNHDDLFGPIIKEAIGADSRIGRFVFSGSDDTLIRKTGRKVPGTTYARDPLSPAFHPNLVLGQRFVQSSIMVRAGGIGTQWRAIPVGFVHAPPLKAPRGATKEQVDAVKENRKKHNVSTVAAKELIRIRNEVYRSPERVRMVHAVDGSFANKTYMGSVPEDVTVIARGRKNARLRAHLPAPERRGSRKYGMHLPTPEEILRDESISVRRVFLFIAGKWRMLKYKELTDVCWPRVAGDKPMRLIVIKAPGYRMRKGSKLLYRQPAFLFALNAKDIPTKTLIEAYLARWEVEVTFRDAKSVIGVGQAQVWNRVSVEKTPAFVAACHACLLLASIKAFGDKRTDAFGPLPAWRKAHQRRPSINDLVNLLRKEARAETDMALDSLKMAI